MTADMEADTFLTIASKRDQRSYASEPIPDEVLEQVLEAGRVSGSAKNTQDRRFIVLSAQARATVASMVTRPSNLEGAAAAVAIVAKPGQWADFDAGRAAQSMMLAAWGSGVGSCPNALADPEGVSGLLAVSGEERVVVLISFGFPPGGHDPSSRTVKQWLSRADRKPRDSVVREV
jgi:nitroreductase